MWRALCVEMKMMGGGSERGRRKRGKRRGMERGLRSASTRRPFVFSTSPFVFPRPLPLARGRILVRFTLLDACQSSQYVQFVAVSCTRGVFDVSEQHSWCQFCTLRFWCVATFFPRQVTARSSAHFGKTLGGEWTCCWPRGDPERSERWERWERNRVEFRVEFGVEFGGPSLLSSSSCPSLLPCGRIQPG